MLIVCSVFDKVKTKSVFITMNENADDAIRDFNRSMSHPQLKDIKNDLILIQIGRFDEKTLEIFGEEPVALKEGAFVETVE